MLVRMFVRYVFFFVLFTFEIRINYVDFLDAASRNENDDL